MSGFANSLAYAVKSSERFMSVYKNTIGALRNASHFSDLKAHEVMLADRVRVDTYHRAIAQHIEEGSTVVDLGTGTGILAMFAARKARKVYAIDHSGMIHKARQAAIANGFSNIEFVKTNSRRFKPPEQVDFIIHEQLSADLFSENMVANLIDLRERVLRPGGRILPAQFDLYLEPVQIKDDYRIPFLWEQNPHHISFASFRRAQPTHSRIMVKPFAVEHFLGEPSPILSVNLNCDGVLPRAATYHRVVTRPGRLDGFCMFFVVRFDEHTAFSTSPFEKHTHWDTPLLRVEAVPCREGEVIEFSTDMVPLNAPDVWRWRYTRHGVGNLAAIGAAAEQTSGARG